MSGNPLIFGILFPVDLVFFGAALYWVWKDFNLKQPPKPTIRQLRRLNAVLTGLMCIWQIFVFYPYKPEVRGSHIPVEITETIQLFFSFFLLYVWTNDYFTFYFLKYHKPFPNNWYRGFMVCIALGTFLGFVRLILAALYVHIGVFQSVNAISGMFSFVGNICVFKLFWDVRKWTKERYQAVLETSPTEEEMPLVQSSNRNKMCKMNAVLVLAVLWLVAFFFLIPLEFMDAISRANKSLPESYVMPPWVVVYQPTQSWIWFGILLWYTKFEWAKDPFLDREVPLDNV